MKNLLFVIMLIPLVLMSQNNEGRSINAYKYIVHNRLEYNGSATDRWGISKQVTDIFKSMGFEVILNPPNLDNINLCEALELNIDHTYVLNGYNSVNIKLRNCLGDEVYANSARAIGLSLRADFRAASKKVMSQLKKMNYSFDESLAIKGVDLFYDLSSLGIDSKSETSFRDYFNKNNTKSIEGIWENDDYRLAIIAKEYYYIAINLTEVKKRFKWNPGDLKARIEPTATSSIMTINWTMGDKKTTKKIVGKNTQDALLEFELPISTTATEKSMMYKVYPQATASNNKITDNSTSNWKGNGSGIILSNSGLIVTNHHVIEDANDIEVEFLIDGVSQNFNAQLVQQDIRNDLAIIKIVDINFDGISNINYNFKTRSSDVGTKIYTFGYPQALTGMGKEIKVTEGIISAKSGVMGDITTYQITAPIQGGNSGGPLFDNAGNLVGINSSRFNSDKTENVNYSIKSAYILNLLDVLPKSIDLPSSDKLQSLPLTEQIKEISKYVVLIKVR